MRAKSVMRLMVWRMYTTSLFHRTPPGEVYTAACGGNPIGSAFAYFEYTNSAYGESLSIAVGAFVIAVVASYSIKIADQWDRTVVLRLGRFRSLEGPGLFFIIPIIETVPYWIDTRVITSSFKAEKTLTKDTVPVDVDAVLFWKVVDPKKAALDVADYGSAISWASQTALRDVIGKTMQAQAERERQARVILGDSEKQVAEKFGEAAKTYVNNPVALHLRATNMLY